MEWKEMVSSSGGEIGRRKVDVWHTGVLAPSEVISHHCLLSEVFEINNKTSALCQSSLQGFKHVSSTQRN